MGASKPASRAGRREGGKGEGGRVGQIFWRQARFLNQKCARESEPTNVKPRLNGPKKTVALLYNHFKSGFS